MPATLRYVDTDTATVYERGADGKKKRLASLFWGDGVKVIGKSVGDWKLDFTTRVWDASKKKYIWKKHDAFMDGDVAFRDTPLLKVRFVDVGEETFTAVTHGDADHFEGLTKLVNGWGPQGKPPITTKRVFHNGLIKGPDALPDKDTLGKTATNDGVTYVTRAREAIFSRGFHAPWPGGNSLSAGHTINGHSIVLRMTYGSVRLLFGADLNDESEQMLVAA